MIVLGYGDLTEAVLDELELGGSDSGDEGEGAGSRTGAGRGTRTGSKVPFVVVATEFQAAHVRESGRDVLVGTPSDEEPLQRAGVERARAVVAATENDAEDAFSILTAREPNPEIRIVAAATDRENVPKLKRAGADTVISPAVIGGCLLGARRARYGSLSRPHRRRDGCGRWPATTLTRTRTVVREASRREGRSRRSIDPEQNGG